MPNQVLTIEPQNELKFKGLFEQGYTTYMRLINPTSDTVLFKIKTTAPKKYCVRPNSGWLEPNSKVDIAITPQPVYVDPNEKHKHKFMVQSVIAPEGKTNIDQVWKEISPEQLMDYKLKCVFEAPRGSNLNDSGDNAATAQNEVTKKRSAEDAKSPAKIDLDLEEPFFSNAFSRPIRQQPFMINQRTVILNRPPQHPLEGYTQNDSKRKDDHANNAAGKTSENADHDLQKAASEVILLREEESKLRQENLQLKEELLRLRQAAGDGRAARRHSYGPEKQAQLALMPWMLTAIGMALLGIIIGKFFM